MGNGISATACGTGITSASNGMEISGKPIPSMPLTVPANVSTSAHQTMTIRLGSANIELTVTCDSRRRYFEQELAFRLPALDDGVRLGCTGQGQCAIDRDLYLSAEEDPE